MRALAVTDSRRLKELPQVPTVAESGAPGFEVTAWTGLFAPAKAPAPVVKALSDAVRTAMQKADSIKFIENLGATTYPGGPQQLRDFQLAEILRTREIVKTAGIPVE
ncbi:Tripartite tricarboxylate transporter family receptor [compost metagenome]